MTPLVLSHAKINYSSGDITKSTTESIKVLLNKTKFGSAIFNNFATSIIEIPSMSSAT